MKKDIAKTLFWKGNTLHLLDQLALPCKVSYKQCTTYTDVSEAIKNHRFIKAVMNTVPEIAKQLIGK